MRIETVKHVFHYKEYNNKTAYFYKYIELAQDSQEYSLKKNEPKKIILTGFQVKLYK